MNWIPSCLPFPRDALSSYNCVQVNQLFLQLAAKFALTAEFSPLNSTFKCVSEIPIGQVTSVTDSIICYQLRLDLYPLHDRRQRITVKANSNFLPRPIINPYDRFLTVSFSRRNYTSLVYARMNSDDYLYKFFTEWKNYKISYDLIYRALAKRGKCNQYRTMENCIEECRIDLIRKLCNCTPTSWSNWAISEAHGECRLTNYTACLKYRGSDDAECAENCSTNECERRSYRYYDTKLLWSENPVLEFQIDSFDYTLFEEREEFSFEDFASSIGGTMGFYLGLDFMQMIRLLLVALMFLAKAVAAVGELVRFPHLQHWTSANCYNWKITTYFFAYCELISRSFYWIAEIFDLIGFATMMCQRMNIKYDFLFNAYCFLLAEMFSSCMINSSMSDVFSLRLNDEPNEGPVLWLIWKLLISAILAHLGQQAINHIIAENVSIAAVIKWATPSTRSICPVCVSTSDRHVPYQKCDSSQITPQGHDERLYRHHHRIEKFIDDIIC